MRPRHKPGCTAFFILLLRAVSASGCLCFGLSLLRAVPASGCKPAPDGGPSRPVGSLSAVSVSGCPRSPTVSGRGLLRFSAVPVPRRFPDADCTGFRLSCSPTVSGRGLHRLPAVLFPDGFRLRFAFGWLFSGGAHGSLRPPPALPVHSDLLLLSDLKTL